MNKQPRYRVVRLPWDVSTRGVAQARCLRYLAGRQGSIGVSPVLLPAGRNV
jgi:hypothetical protein